MKGKGYVPKAIIAELIQGAHSKKEISAIDEFVEAFHLIGENDESWHEAGVLFWRLKKKGKT